MTDDFSEYTEEIFGEYIFEGESTPEPPNVLYVALHSGDPGDNGLANELDASDYDRIQTDHDDWQFDSGPNPSTWVNDTDFSFGIAEANWGVVSHASIWDGPIGDDNCLYAGSVDEKDIDEGDEVVFREGLINARIG